MQKFQLKEYSKVVCGFTKIEIIKINSINGIDISETENQQTTNLKNKIVFSILDATDVVKVLMKKDDFGKFTHYRNLAGVSIHLR